MNGNDAGHRLLLLALVAAASGVVIGIVGAAFRVALIQADDARARLLSWAHQWPDIGWLVPAIVGGGDPITQGMLDGRLALSLLAIVLVARWLLGPFSYAAGTPGGLFAPLLVVGAVRGAIFADALNRLLPGIVLDTTKCAIVGKAAVFTAVVRAPLAGTLLMLGMTGTILPLAPALAACVCAMIVPAYLGSAPIYDTLRERMLAIGATGRK